MSPAQNFHWQVRLARHDSEHGESLFERLLSHVPTKRPVKYLFNPFSVHSFNTTLSCISNSVYHNHKRMQIIILKLEEKTSEVSIYCTMRADAIYDAMQSAMSTEIHGKHFIIMDSKHNRKARYTSTS